MKVFTESRENRMQMDKHLEGSPPMPHEHDFGRPLPPHERHGRPIPPHERRAMMHVEFGEDDIALLDTIFGDPDTAMAAAYIIQDAPPEIQILAIQLMKMNGSSTFLTANSGIDSQVRFPSPTMDESAQNLYAELYSDAGARFVGILNSSPNEIAVISRLIAYLDDKTKEVS